MAEVTIQAANGGSFSAYLATPKSGHGPGIVLIQEIFGVNDVMRDLADGFASEGYTVMCPDLFWRLKPGVQLSDKTQAEWKEALDLMGRFDVELGVEDIKSTMATLRNHPACTGKVGAVGYCLGGRLAYLTATRSDSDATVGYYGLYIQNSLGEAKNIKKPLMLHIAEGDDYVPPEAQKAIKDGLKDHSRVTIYSYPSVGHAFARLGGEHYDKSAADLANRRTSEFFKHNLAA